MRDLLYRVITSVVLAALMFSFTRTAIGQVSPEEAQRRMLKAEGKATNSEKLSDIPVPDLTNYDADTLRSLASISSQARKSVSVTLLTSPR